MTSEETPTPDSVASERSSARGKSTVPYGLFIDQRALARAEPSQQAAEIGWVEANDLIEIVGVAGDFVEIRWHGRRGYIYGRLGSTDVSSSRRSASPSVRPSWRANPLLRALLIVPGLLVLDLVAFALALGALGPCWDPEHGCGTGTAVLFFILSAVVVVLTVLLFIDVLVCVLLGVPVLLARVVAAFQALLSRRSGAAAR
jgi:hypothetical protein